MSSKRLIPALVVALLPLSFGVADASVNAAQVKAAQTAAARSDAAWVLSAQLPDGAIPHYSDRAAVWPYLSSFGALGLARATQVTGDARYVEASWRWLSWYQAHQDATGFVTDYVVENGAPRSIGDMDSTDSYAGMFLLAARQSWKVTGNTTRLGRLRAGINGAVRAIEATQDADGLTWAKPAWHVKYIMDQAEAFAGLRAAAEMSQALGNSSLANRANADADRMQAGFDALWNPATRAYDWAVHGNGVRQPTNWSVLYPDALEQVWPVAFGLVKGSRATQLMARFDAAQPNWDRPAATATFAGGPGPVGYWPVAGWAFDRTGNTNRAAVASTRIRAAALAANRAWPFTTGIAGQLIQLGTADAGYLAATPTR